MDVRDTYRVFGEKTRKNPRKCEGFTEIMIAAFTLGKQR